MSINIGYKYVAHQIGTVTSSHTLTSVDTHVNASGEGITLTLPATGGVVYVCNTGAYDVTVLYPNGATEVLPAGVCVSIDMAVAHWLVGTAYSIGDPVAYGFVDYWAVTDHTGSTPPSSDWSTDYVPAVPFAGTYATFDPLTWIINPATLSNGNLTATYAFGDGAGDALSSIPITTGKWYWEITRVGGQGTVVESKIGVWGAANLEGSSSMYGIYWSIYPPGAIDDVIRYIARTNISVYSGFTVHENNVIGVAFDFDNGTLMIFINGVNIAGEGNFVFDNNGPFDTTTDPVYACVEMEGDAMTANFGASAFTYSPPSGYNSGLYTL